MPQINELTTRTFDGDSLIGFDVENTDPQTQAQYPYVTGKADGNALADFIANEQEYVTDLDTVDKHITGAINEHHAVIGYSYDAYDDTSTYAVGDLCIYNNALYKCTTAITTAEAWNASHWTATSIADEINELKSGVIKELVISSSSYKFNSLSWTASGSGIYYTTIDLDNILPSGTKIVGITINGWNNIRTTDNVMPYIRTNRTFGLMSNVNSFDDNNSAYGYSILYTTI